MWRWRSVSGFGRPWNHESSLALWTRDGLAAELFANTQWRGAMWAFTFDESRNGFHYLRTARSIVVFRVFRANGPLIPTAWAKRSVGPGKLVAGFVRIRMRPDESAVSRLQLRTHSLMFHCRMTQDNHQWLALQASSFSRGQEPGPTRCLAQVIRIAVPLVRNHSGILPSDFGASSFDRQFAASSGFSQSV